MHVEVQMGDLLKGSLTERVPHTQALVWESSSDSAGNARGHRHECGTGWVVQLAHVTDMLPRIRHS